MVLKLVEDDEVINEAIIQNIGVSKMKTKCILVTNIVTPKKKIATNKFWIKNQSERKEKFKEFLSELLI